MLKLSELQRLVGALCGEILAPQVGQIGWFIQRLIARIRGLDEAERNDLIRASLGVQPTIDALLQAAATSRRLDASEVRDLTTVHRRLSTILAHLGSRPGGERLDAEALHVGYARVDLVDVVGRACACFERLAVDRRLAYQVSLPGELIVEVDVDKTELAIGNALFNAFKYAPEGGVVRCVMSVDELLQDVVISIEDSGPGVHPAQLDAIFDRSRVVERNVAIRVGKVRLALGTSRDLIALQGGILDAVPTSTGHALFEIRLPRWAPRAAPVSVDPPKLAAWMPEAVALAEAELRAEAELDARPVADDGRPVVLVIEGSRALNRALVGCLGPDCATVSAFHGRAGVELASDLRPDLVIVDLRLPELGGEQVIEILREREELQMPILALTSSRDEPQVLRLLEAGVDDIMVKPVLLAELRARARRLLMAKRTHDVLSEAIGQRDTDLIALANQVADTHHSLERAYADLEAARERAERMNETKSNFLRIMSHELKTPVTAMKLQLRVLESDPGVLRTPSLDRGLERIDRSVRRLVDLVDTMLEWARVEDGRYQAEIEPFDPAELADEVAARLESHARVRGTELVVDDVRERPVDSVSDRRLVRLVLLNLVERAISVSNEARVEIRVAASGLGHRIHIRDAGPPLSEEQRAEVFDPVGRTRDFHRLSGAGSGIGVYAIRDIARAVGGELRWEDADGTGNDFVFEVPSRLEGGSTAVSPGMLGNAVSPALPSTEP
ncbi:ATP-binding response regulator [Paraliomyxa miuraensis]|uniref:ATP-binding response regulator n=1 Tax=Paraliomyxa miuraensis TaxID=376150 RepID=UPI002251B089|nr:ATP-binding protein [Paraliomyxa miuraensis]MCX4246837.1 ATP-binding protein [Paraliomyxa miuraensis]